MCRRTSCSRCGKPSWAGCGAHVEQVLGDVAPVDRCRCDEGASVDAGAGGRGARGRGARKGVLARLLGR